MRARDLMSYPAIACHVNDSLASAARQMWEHDCGSLAVVKDEGVLTGMVTDRDICMAAYTQGRPLEEILVHSAMASHVVCATDDVGIEDIERMMAEHQIRRVPIIDADHRPIGMVTIADLATECVKPASHLQQGRFAHTLASIERRRQPSTQEA
ncbi:MAG: CBS domain-containing protein [Casimicrobiaceae bacterium]